MKWTEGEVLPGDERSFRSLFWSQIVREMTVKKVDFRVVAKTHSEKSAYAVHAPFRSMRHAAIWTGYARPTRP